MLKAAFYQVEQCQEPPEEIRAEMQEFAADVGLGFHAFYMDSPKAVVSFRAQQRTSENGGGCV